jgi:transcriptional regulator with XRE-family HTH domain
MILKQIAEQKGFSSYRLAKESGVPISTVGGLWRGVNRLSESKAWTVFRLAKTLQMSVEDLLLSEHEGSERVEKENS